MSILEILWKYRLDFLLGLWVTLKMCLIIWPVGISLGTLLGVLGSRWKGIVGLPSRFISFILSGVPTLVFLFWLHYPCQTLLGVVVHPFYTAVAAFTIINLFLVADVVRRSLDDFPSQYIMAAKVCGLTSFQTALGIQLPIVFRQVLPSVLVIQVTMLQATLFASLISVDEVFRVAQRVNSLVYRPVEIYSALALLFLVICLPLYGIAYWLRARFSRDVSEH